MKTVSKYLPLKKFHIVEINSLTPEAIKISAKRAKIDREDIPHTTLLNAIVHSLGFKGGFAEYEKHFQASLMPFMEQHGLKKSVDLITPRKAEQAYFVRTISSQKLSERIFFSNWKIPEKVFTGYNFDYENTIGLHSRDVYFAFQSLGLSRSTAITAIQNKIKLAQESPNQLVYIHENEKRRLIDIVVGSFGLYNMNTFHLIGDALVKPTLLPTT